jgi:hypothetical protein
LGELGPGILPEQFEGEFEHVAERQASYCVRYRRLQRDDVLHVS